jgi:hypothetical protein
MNNKTENEQMNKDYNITSKNGANNNVLCVHSTFYLNSSEHFMKSLNHDFYGWKWPKRWSSPNTYTGLLSPLQHVPYTVNLIWAFQESHFLLIIPFQNCIGEFRKLILLFFALKHIAKLLTRQSCELGGPKNRRAREDCTNV